VNAQLKKGLAVAAIHLALVGSLGAKLLVDRATRPRVWARTGPVDPDDPIRGRYVRLSVEGEIDAGPAGIDAPYVTLSANGQALVVTPTTENTGLSARVTQRDARRVAILDQPLAFFIPEHVPDPSRRGPGEELWVEVTLPKHGAPRPIRLAVKKEGVLTPLPLR